MMILRGTGAVPMPGLTNSQPYDATESTDSIVDQSALGGSTHENLVKRGLMSWWEDLRGGNQAKSTESNTDGLEIGEDAGPEDGTAYDDENRHDEFTALAGQGESGVQDPQGQKRAHDPDSDTDDEAAGLQVKNFDMEAATIPLDARYYDSQGGSDPYNDIVDSGAVQGLYRRQVSTDDPIQEDVIFGQNTDLTKTRDPATSQPTETQKPGGSDMSDTDTDSDSSSAIGSSDDEENPDGALQRRDLGLFKRQYQDELTQALSEEGVAESQEAQKPGDETSSPGGTSTSSESDMEDGAIQTGSDGTPSVDQVESVAMRKRSSIRLKRRALSTKMVKRMMINEETGYYGDSE